MYKPSKSVLITDLDNTLYDWFEIWYSSFNAMLERVVEISGISKEQLIKEIRPVHREHGTAEYAFVLEKLPSLQKKYGSRQRINDELSEAIHAYRSERMTHLKLYKGVYDTLAELKSRRVRVIAYTESKEWYTKNRLKRLGLDYFIEILYSPSDHSVPIEEEQRTEITFDFMKSKHTPEGELKPNPRLLLDIIKEIGATPEECVYVGDSEMKDVEMALQAGVTAVFAKYGTGHFEGDDRRYELLQAVTHWTDADVEREQEIKRNSKHLKPDYTIDRFDQLLEIINFRKKKA
ncbi:HAD family hydrolase [Pseudidiomarina sediminum]|uniref:HAD family hydrolase n=1 Tax=Pseudidiomarina sediminum TaxID=431675 RepID=UPI0004110745|nr:HAD family hydrolase [Pseudidiomarina sediminum]